LLGDGMNIRLLKTLVAVMGVMLVVGVVFLVVAIASRLAHRAPTASAVAFTAPPITLPHGATIERMSSGADRIVLDVALADGSVELVVIDLATGRLLGIIPLKEAP
jgi:Family of unknown function (DUF6476)